MKFRIPVSLIIFMILLGCKQDDPIPYKMGDTVIINSMNISPLSSTSLQDYKISFDITDPANNEQYTVRVTTSVGVPEGLGYFTDTHFITEDTRVVETEYSSLVSLNNLKSPNAFIIEFKNDAEEAVKHGALVLRAEITPETLLNISVQSDSRANRYKSNIQTLLKKDLDEAFDVKWAKDTNWAQEGEQTQYVVVSYRRNASRSVYLD